MAIRAVLLSCVCKIFLLSLSRLLTRDHLSRAHTPFAQKTKTTAHLTRTRLFAMSLFAVVDDSPSRLIWAQLAAVIPGAPIALGREK